MKIKDSNIESLNISGDYKKPDANTNKEPAIDMDFLSDITGNDLAFRNELFVLFLDTAQSNISKMEKSLLIDNGNDIWYAASHSLKGASTSIGAFEMSKVLEYAQANSKEDPKNKTKILDEAKVHFAKVAEFIKDEMAKA